MYNRKDQITKAVEVAMLRALLVTWDEEALPPGTMYTVPVVMEDSRVVSEWQPEHDD